jgi:hypothetical protein
VNCRRRLAAWPPSEKLPAKSSELLTSLLADASLSLGAVGGVEREQNGQRDLVDGLRIDALLDGDQVEHVADAAMHTSHGVAYLKGLCKVVRHFLAIIP